MDEIEVIVHISLLNFNNVEGTNGYFSRDFDDIGKLCMLMPLAFAIFVELMTL